VINPLPLFPPGTSFYSLIYRCNPCPLFYLGSRVRRPPLAPFLIFFWSSSPPYRYLFSRTPPNFLPPSFFEMCPFPLPLTEKTSNERFSFRFFSFSQLAVRELGQTLFSMMSLFRLFLDARYATQSQAEGPCVPQLGRAPC